MEIAVRARDILWNEDLQQRVQRSIEFAVDRHSGRIDRISVYLTDLNGPRGGVDKLCQITAEVRGAKPVMILEKGDDLLAAVSRAARRLGYRIGRRVHRRRMAGAPEHRGTIREA
jgi:putative sigma-54 modulation protein